MPLQRFSKPPPSASRPPHHVGSRRTRGSGPRIDKYTPISPSRATSSRLPGLPGARQDCKMTAPGRCRALDSRGTAWAKTPQHADPWAAAPAHEAAARLAWRHATFLRCTRSCPASRRESGRSRPPQRFCVQAVDDLFTLAWRRGSAAAATAVIGAGPPAVITPDRTLPGLLGRLRGEAGTRRHQCLGDSLAPFGGLPLDPHRQTGGRGRSPARVTSVSLPEAVAASRRE